MTGMRSQTKDILVHGWRLTSKLYRPLKALLLFCNTKHILWSRKAECKHNYLGVCNGRGLWRQSWLKTYNNKLKWICAGEEGRQGPYPKSSLIWKKKVIWFGWNHQSCPTMHCMDMCRGLCSVQTWSILVNKSNGVSDKDRCCKYTRLHIQMKP